MKRSEIIVTRRALRLPGYCTITDVDMDGDYVSPLQIQSNSESAPVLLAYNWLDAESVRLDHAVLRVHGYLPGIPFNNVVTMALGFCGITRSDIYMTQVFHLLPAAGRSSSIPANDLDYSFDAVTRHELVERKVIALGTSAAATCKRFGVTPEQVVDHPSARGLGRTVRAKAEHLANAIRATHPALQISRRNSL